MNFISICYWQHDQLYTVEAPEGGNINSHAQQVLMLERAGLVEVVHKVRTLA